MVILSRGIKRLLGNIKISTNQQKIAEHEIMIGKQILKFIKLCLISSQFRYKCENI
jgi:hypothetical protein